MDNEVLIKAKENHQKILDNTTKFRKKIKKQGKTLNDLHDNFFNKVIKKKRK